MIGWRRLLPGVADLIAKQHASDADLRPLTRDELELLIPHGPHVMVLRESAMEREPAQLERWSRSFVLTRLQNDGAFDASPVSTDPKFGIVTRALSGERIFVKTGRH